MAYHSNGGYSGDERESRSGDDRPDSDLGDKPIYLLEHLATFTVNKETGIVFPADGMRRLLQLEKTTGIWSQKMQLCLDRQWVLIMDYETGNIIERFPASLIQTPTAFTSNDPMEMYNNILVFIVGGGSGSRSEMHIFQCQSISAVHLVEDLKQLRNGKPALQHRETIPQQQQAPPPPPPIKSQKMVRESFNYSHETDSEIGNLNDETSSTSSEKYERDVTVLNHCFDDIEKFIARLQHAAAASRELERRLRNRKSKKKDPGEGLLTLRTRPPHEKEFIDIFAKFKLSFNLLAKLKAHIHDPNAPELVHFLFTPLALIVDASHDTYYDPNLPSRVINPLLTREAINLLINCVTSKETELWRSLGEAWTVPKDQWKGHTASYHPVFFDGWSPDYPVVDELDQAPSTPTNIKKRIELQQHYSGDYDYETSQQSQHQQSPGSPGLRDFSARSDISIDSIERNGGIPPHNGVAQKSMAPLAAVAASNAAASSGGMMHEQRASVAGVGGVSGGSGGGAGAGGAAGWIEEMQARGAKIVQVTYPRTANNDKELTVVRGEYLEIIDDSRKWWKAKNSRGQVAHVPHTIVTMVNYNDSLNSPAYTQNNYGKQLNRQDSVSERYTQSGDSNPGNGPVPLQPASADWVRNKHIVSGSITGSMSSEDDMVELRSDRAMIGNGMNVPPPPPPPPPTAAPPPPRTLSRPNSMSRQSIISNTSAANAPQDVMQEELKQVLTLFREKRRTIEIMRTPEIFIQQSSSSSDVEKWLVAKGFSDKVVKKMHGLNGNELFALKRDTLEDYCGHDEGKRLASQITVQRNISGYKTARSTELQAILAKARKKTEE